MRYVLLTYNAPDALEIWAAMTESERRAEEDEYVRLVEAMQKRNAYLGANELEPPTPTRLLANYDELVSPLKLRLPGRARGALRDAGTLA